jgi:AraC-like DNA-binding protein
MNRFSYTGDNYQILQRDFTIKNKGEAGQPRISMPSNIGNGYSHSFELGNGLSVLVAECSYVADFILQREASEKLFFILQFNKVQVTTSEVNKAGKLVKKITDRSEVTFSSSKHKAQVWRKSGTDVRSVKVIIPGQWFNSLGNPNLTEELEKMVAKKDEKLYRLPLLPEIKSLLNRVLDAVKKGGIDRLLAENRILLMVEKFFLQAQAACPNVCKEQIQSEIRHRLAEAERLLIEKAETTRPSLAELSRAAAMSATRLKKLFKEVYGQPIYKYYRHKKMMKAASLILEKGISVKEAALVAGYSNTSHFTVAFQKETGSHPLNYKTHSQS